MLRARVVYRGGGGGGGVGHLRKVRELREPWVTVGDRIGGPLGI